jgi:hypothetical protein
LIELASSAFHGSSREDFVMDTIELRAAATRLASLHERFASCFGRREATRIVRQLKPTTA